jgi:protein TonB
MGGGLRHIGGGVSAPVPIHTVEPEFSEEARKAKFAGNVLVYLVVDAQGHPQNVHVIKPVGMGLDQKAVDAVKQYLFKPAMEGGKPVPVELSIEVDFQIF